MKATRLQQRVRTYATAAESTKDMCSLQFLKISPCGVFFLPNNQDILTRKLCLKRVNCNQPD